MRGGALRGRSLSCGLCVLKKALVGHRAPGAITLLCVCARTPTSQLSGRACPQSISLPCLLMSLMSAMATTRPRVFTRLSPCGAVTLNFSLCSVVRCETSPQAHSFEPLVPRQRWCLGKLLWRTRVTWGENSARPASCSGSACVLVMPASCSCHHAAHPCCHVYPS